MNYKDGHTEESGMNYNEGRISDHDELNEMFHEDEHIDEASRTDVDTDKKVFVKQMPVDNQAFNGEGGFGSVLGVVLVIVAISFILAALFIRMLI